MSHQRRAAAFVLLTALLLTGCTSVAPMPSPSPSVPLSTSTPEPTSTEAAPVVTPNLPFGGDCASVLRAPDLDELLGEGWLSYDEFLAIEGYPDYPRMTPLGTLGGLECSWWVAAPDDADFGTLSILVAPAASIPGRFAEMYADARCDGHYNGTECRLSRTVGDAWILVRAGDTVQDLPTAVLTRALDAVAVQGAEAFDAVPATAQSTWWTIPDCVTLAEDMSLADVLGVGYGGGDGFWEGSPSPERIMEQEAGVSLMCEWWTQTVANPPSIDGESHMPMLTLSAGGAWQWNEIAAFEGVERVDVAGAEDAVLFISDDEFLGPLLYATDGVNVLEVGWGTDSVPVLTMIAEKALAALG